MSRFRRRITAATMAVFGAVAEAIRLLRSKRTVAALLLLSSCFLTVACNGAGKSQTGRGAGCAEAKVVVTKIYAKKTSRPYCGLTNVSDPDLKNAFLWGEEVIKGFESHQYGIETPLKIVIAEPDDVVPNGGSWDKKRRAVRLESEHVFLDYVARGVAYSILDQVAPELGDRFDESGAVRVAFGDAVAGVFAGETIREGSDGNDEDIQRVLSNPERFGGAVRFSQFDRSGTAAATKYNSTILSHVMYKLTATVANQRSMVIEGMKHLPHDRPARFSDVRAAFLTAVADWDDTSVSQRVKEAFDKVGVTAR